MIGRYEVLAELGRSSLGAVYAATDRLTGRRVALRRITAPVVESAAGDPPDSDLPGSDPPGSDLGLERRRPSAGLLRLSWQLRRIASLRHPNLASIIDYGFDRRLRPFYVHKLIEQPVELLEAACGQPTTQRLDLLIQTLQGLTYLHRRGAVHGDLRPRTALVEGDRVRLVNFGISAARYGELGEVGDATVFDRTVFDSTVPDTEVAYLAPEIRQGGQASAAADLYAVGVLVYRMLSNRSPALGEATPGDAEPDSVPAISTRDFAAPLIPVLERLLSADPGERYGDATDVIRDLAAAYSVPYPEESAAVRESFLEAARFVGRERETERLAAALRKALEGRGSALIVAGESGVGKSRLLDELRILALAGRTFVFWGRAASEGYSPYHSWHRILRHLCLEVAVEPDEAVVLEQHVPGLGELLGRQVEAPRTLDPVAAKQRFAEVVEGLFSRLRRPAMVVLEDLHWAGSESLDLLLTLQSRVSEWPLLLIGTYRDDERPDLSVTLADIPCLELQRVDRSTVAALAESMLGPRGKAAELVDFLYRETQGNLFFLVEILRALGEEAGRLDRIDPERLPEQVTTGGIERILQRRLERLPKRVRPLLRRAAVAGREIDLQLLEALEPGVQSRLWLRFCSDQAVLEAVDGVWRFASDRYRDALLAELPASALRAAHRQVAEAITAVHGGTAGQVPALAYHWARAADLSDPEATDLAVTYLGRAGVGALGSCANREAEALFRQGLELLGTLPGGRDLQECRLQTGLGGAYLMSRGFTEPEVGQAFSRAHRLGVRLARPKELMPALLGLWRFHVTRADLDTARELADEMRH
ncbi:MAG: AAA family ATPase, partial [Acidobacteriota bacterium]